jgi:hypothetical protein
VVLYSELFGALEMIGALEKVIYLILLTSFFFDASVWILGLLVRKEGAKNGGARKQANPKDGK